MRSYRDSVLLGSQHPASPVRHRAGLAGFLLGSFALFASITNAAAQHMRPYVPSSPNVVLQRVPSETDPRVRHFDLLRAQLDGAPHNMRAAVKLADAYIDYGRSTGDARFLGRARAVIEPWMRVKLVPIPVLLVHATLLQSRHFFQASRIQLNAILERDPGNAQAWLTLATVAMVQGDYATANEACVQLAQTGGNFMGTLCTAQLRSLDGHARQAYALMKLIEHPGPEAPAAIKSYVEGLLADTAARLGNSAEAQRHFETALQWAPGDNFLLADYGDFLLDQHRPREVIALLADYQQSDTSFLRMVFAEAALHDPRAPHDIAEMQARFVALNQRGSRVYQREHAMFVLYVKHEPAHALRLAEENWTVQRAPKDMRIYLQAALAASQPQAAKPVLALLASSHLQDPTIASLTDAIASARQGAHVVARRGGTSP